MPDTWLVVGLGNPGSRYERTRHNIGQLVLDELADRRREPFRAHKANARVAETWSRPGGARLILAKPNSFMNVSGGPVSGLASYYRVEPDHVVVVHDELDIPFRHAQAQDGRRARRSQRCARCRQGSRHGRVRPCARRGGPAPRQQGSGPIGCWRSSARPSVRRCRSSSRMPQTRSSSSSTKDSSRPSSASTPPADAAPPPPPPSIRPVRLVRTASLRPSVPSAQSHGA